MKIASLSEIKKEINQLETDDIKELIFHLIKCNKENKEFLNYLLFERDFEDNYIQKIKQYIQTEFESLDKRSWKTMKKSIQRILKSIKKHIKYSKQPITEIELLLFFCYQLREQKVSFQRYPIILNIYVRQISAIEKAILKIHEDLRGDFQEELLMAKEILI